MYSAVVENITFSYDRHMVLSDLSFHFPAGKITCLLGPSGCGKTSLLRLIAGLEILQEGIIKINDKVVSVAKTILVPPHKRELGFIFQDLALWSHFTVFENISFGLKERKESNFEKKVLEMLNIFGIAGHIQKYPHQLSGGQKQMVAIARSLVLKPKILLMDEPLANIDNEVKNKIMLHLQQLRREDPFTMLYVTHDRQEAIEIGDNIVIMNKGKITESRTAEDFRQTSASLKK